MKALTFLLILAVFCFPILVYGGTLREIELTDGSVVRAEVVSMSRGVYRLRSDTLGEIEVPEYRVRAIRSLEVQTVGPQAHPEPSKALSTNLQQRLLQDSAAMEKIFSLQNDPLVQSILSDESTMRAIKAGDMGALLNNPKIRALMAHPTVQELGRKYGD